MATINDAPHWNTTVIDNSSYTPLVHEELPLFTPIFFFRASEGPCGVPQWMNGSNSASSIFGSGTFDKSTKYYSREALYLEKIFELQGAYGVRLADSATAKKASAVLRAYVTPGLLPQYAVDDDGYYQLDLVTGDRIPLVDENGLAVQEPGHFIEYKITPFQEMDGEMEDLDNLRIVTAGDIKMIPIIAGDAKSVGEYADYTGFKFWCDTDNPDTTRASITGSIPFNFEIIRKTYGQDTTSTVYTNLQDKNVTFVARPDAIDTRMDLALDFNSVLEYNYDESDIPWDIRVYSENIKELGQMIMDVEPDDDTLTDPYLVNITSEKNIEGKPMRHVSIVLDGEDSIFLNDNLIMYFTGGSDGPIDDGTIEMLTRQYLDDLVYPELMDQPRYPFTHIIDTGVSIDTKKSFIRFLGEHDAFKVILATQDCTMGRYMTKAEDLSMGSALHAACLLQPESMQKGTGVCRAEIYQQAGYLVNSAYTGIVSTTYDVIGKKSAVMSTSTVTGKFSPRPKSDITCFKTWKWNWTPCDMDHKQRSWDIGCNYFQHYDRTGIHWPSMRTVYKYDTSVLSSALFTDIVVYTKRIARYNWSTLAGSEDPFTELEGKIIKNITNDMKTMLGNIYGFTVTAYQTEEDAKLGYRCTVDITLIGHAQSRVWNINIICERSGYNSGGNS